MNRNIIFALCVCTLLFSGQGSGYIGTVTKLDDLYRIAIKSSEFRGMSEQAFRAALRTGKVSRLAPLLKNLPKEDRIMMLVEIAEERALISGTQQLRLARRYSKIDGGDELLMEVIDQGDKALFDLAPRYGRKLIDVESDYKGAGVSVVTHLSEAGWKVMNQIPENQIPRFAAHSKRIASLETGSRTRFLDAITAYPVRALEYLDSNSSIVYTATGATGFLIFIDNLSQPAKTTETKLDGTVIETQSGPFSDLGASGKYLQWAFWILLAGLSAWVIIQVWGSLRRKQIELEKMRTPPDN